MGINSKNKRDIYYYYAKKDGYRARSVYKLQNIFEHYPELKKANNVIDLCAAPGSWSQLLTKLMTGRVIAVDVQEIAPIPGVILLKEDITSESCFERITTILEGQSVELVVCDGAPDVTGIHDLDEYLQQDLLKAALRMAITFNSASIICKCFRGRYTGYLVNHLKKFYRNVELLKPISSRNESIECFLVARGLYSKKHDPMEIKVEDGWEPFEMIKCGKGVDPDLLKDLDYENLENIQLPICTPYDEAMRKRREISNISEGMDCDERKGSDGRKGNGNGKRVN